MDIKKAALTIALVSTLLPSLSASAGYTVNGHGTKSCGVWIEARKHEDDTIDAVIFSVWVSGFVSGVGYANINLKDSDPDGRANWIDNYCKAHPLDDVSNAAQALVNELEVKE